MHCLERWDDNTQISSVRLKIWKEYRHIFRKLLQFLDLSIGDRHKDPALVECVGSLTFVGQSWKNELNWQVFQNLDEISTKLLDGR